MCVRATVRALVCMLVGACMYLCMYLCSRINGINVYIVISTRAMFKCVYVCA